MGLMKELNDLNNIYQDMYTEDENKGYVVTAADKKVTHLHGKVIKQVRKRKMANQCINLPTILRMMLRLRSVLK